MPSAVWSSLPVVLGLLLWHPAGASGPCWESSKCQDLSSEARILVSLGTGTALQSSLVSDALPGTGAVGLAEEVMGMPTPWGDAQQLWGDALDPMSRGFWWGCASWLHAGG